MSYSSTIKEKEKFNNEWYSDEDAALDACTAKSTIYTTNLIAGMVCKIVKDFTHSNSYVSVCDWNIGLNSMDSWASDGRHLN